MKPLEEDEEGDREKSITVTSSGTSTSSSSDGETSDVRNKKDDNLKADSSDAVDLVNTYTRLHGELEASSHAQQEEQTPGAFLGTPHGTFEMAPAFHVGQLPVHSNSNTGRTTIPQRHGANLNNSNSNRNDTSSLVEAREVAHITTVSEEAVPVEPLEDTESQKWVLYFWVGSIGVIFLVVGLLVLLLLLLKSNDASSSESTQAQLAPTFPASTNAPTVLVAPALSADNNYGHVVGYPITTTGTSNLPSYTQSSLQDPLSVQSQAFYWLQDHPQLHKIPQWRRRQLFALATFYYAFHGPDWPLGINLEWLDYQKHECYWFSAHFYVYKLIGGSDNVVTYEFVNGTDNQICNERGEYTVLHLESAANLGFTVPNAAFPPELSWLTSLEYINFYEGGVKNVSTAPALFPSQYFHQLTNLQFLYLGFNDWNIPIPSELGLLTKLSLLKLQKGSFYGQIPSQLGLLTALLQLDLSLNALTSTIPTELTRLSNLRWLGLRNNRLSGTLPDFDLLSDRIGRFMVEENGDLSGRIPEGFCRLGGSPDLSQCSTPYLESVGKKYRTCVLGFDCTDLLCGCDCPCNVPNNATE